MLRKRIARARKPFLTLKLVYRARLEEIQSYDDLDEDEKDMLFLRALMHKILEG